MSALEEWRSVEELHTSTGALHYPNINTNNLNMNIQSKPGKIIYKKKV